MAGWNLADVLELVARKIPASPALIHGARVLTWEQVDTHSSATGSNTEHRRLHDRS